METITSLLAVIVGLLLRLAIPIALTALLIFFLRKLDARWQAEAELPQPVAQTVECWKIKDCPPEQLENCVAHESTLPCWQAKRLPNGYLREECLTCEIFTEAPMPALKTEPRRI
jgi:hypothetical protein